MSILQSLWKAITKLSIGWKLYLAAVVSFDLANLYNNGLVDTFFLTGCFLLVAAIIVGFLKFGDDD